MLLKLLNTHVIYWLLDSSAGEPLGVGGDRPGDSGARGGFRALTLALGGRGSSLALPLADYVP